MENYCKKCKAIISEKHTYCYNCNELYNIEIAVTNKFLNDLPRTINFFKVKLIDMFRKHDKIILSFTKNNAHIADIVIKDTNFFYLQGARHSITEKSRNSPNKIEFIKAPLKLITSVVALKKDREERKLKWYD